MKFWSNEEIEALTNRRLRDYEKIMGRSIEGPPVPVDLIIENEPFNLKISWEKIEEKPGETVLGGLRPWSKQIVMNERHLDLFAEKPGLERFTKGHELGHWDLFVDKTLPNQPSLMGNASGHISMLRGSTKGLVEVVFNLFESKDEAYGFIQDYLKDKDTPYERRAVNRYSSSLLMERDLIKREIQEVDLTNWPSLYQLAHKFGVTISAFCVRLQQLGLIYICEDGQVHRSKAEYFGQRPLAF